MMNNRAGRAYPTPDGREHIPRRLLRTPPPRPPASHHRSLHPHPSAAALRPCHHFAPLDSLSALFATPQYHGHSCARPAVPQCQKKLDRYGGGSSSNSTFYHVEISIGDLATVPKPGACSGFGAAKHGNEIRECESGVDRRRKSACHRLCCGVGSQAGHGKC
jgi:hypothetical protein